MHFDPKLSILTSKFIKLAFLFQLTKGPITLIYKALRRAVIVLMFNTDTLYVGSTLVILTLEPLCYDIYNCFIYLNFLIHPQTKFEKGVYESAGVWPVGWSVCQPGRWSVSKTYLEQSHFLTNFIRTFA